MKDNGGISQAPSDGEGSGSDSDEGTSDGRLRRDRMGEMMDEGQMMDALKGVMNKVSSFLFDLTECGSWGLLFISLPFRPLNTWKTL